MSMTFYIATKESSDNPLTTGLDYDRSEASENYANVNARLLLRTVGLPTDADYDGGLIPPQEVANVLQVTLRALNTRKGRAMLVREGYETARGNVARVIECGSDDDYAQRALARFARLLHRAATLKRAVYWG